MARPGPKNRAVTGQRAGDETRAKLISAALEALHEEGIVGASARSIASRGGFTQGLIFYHFGSVNELLLAAVDELSSRRAQRYEEKLASVTSLRELVAVAGELHKEDLEEGHITVLSQMLAGAATNPELRAPLRERFEPWIAIVESTLTRAIAGTPYAQLVPSRDLAVGITSLFIGLELMLGLEDDESGVDQRIFKTIELLAGVLEGLLGTPPPPAE